MGLKHNKEPSPLLGMMFLILLCAMTTCFVGEQRTNPLDSVGETESCASVSNCVCCIACHKILDVDQSGFHRRYHLENCVPEVEPHPRQDLVIAFIFQCLSGRRLPTVMWAFCGLSLMTVYVLKLKVTRKVCSNQDGLSPVESKEPTSGDQTDANDFLREVASLYQEAVREVDFATVGRRVGLKDYQIEEIINNQAEELRGEAMLKYRDWYSTKSPQGRDDLRDDIVAERIKLLPDILVQYKRPQRCVAYAG